MARIVKLIAALLSLALLSAMALVLAARNGWLTPSDEELRLRYALPASQFIELDGATIHFIDEGSGVPVVLMHGSFGSLRDWDAAAQVLRSDYRVIRYDLPRLGLSGPTPVGNDGLEADIAMIGALANELQLERFVLISTSSSAASAMAWAAQNPERLYGLVLSNFAIAPIGMDLSHLSPWFKLVLAFDRWFDGWHPRALWREAMRNGFHVDARIADDYVARWTDLNNRAQRMPPRSSPMTAKTMFTRAPDDLAKITVPTLLTWSEFDEEMPLETVGFEALDMLATEDRTLIVVPDCGHMLPLECGAQSAELALPFLERVAGN
jgi:pimeloyl-ACP methyl ester carboxylesterase